jgi:coenzyme F420-reducing hydrogenase delta subunit
LVAERNVQYVREILKSAGLSPERIQIFYCSAAEGQRFQEEVTRISAIIEKLGKNPFKEVPSSKKDTNESNKKEKIKTD